MYAKLSSLTPTLLHSTRDSPDLWSYQSHGDQMNSTRVGNPSGKRSNVGTEFWREINNIILLCHAYSEKCKKREILIDLHIPFTYYIYLHTGVQLLGIVLRENKIKSFDWRPNNYIYTFTRNIPNFQTRSLNLNNKKNYRVSNRCKQKYLRQFIVCMPTIIIRLIIIIKIMILYSST